MKVTSKRGVWAVLIAVLAASCGQNSDKQTLLDAAALYNEKPAVFASIRSAFPGPFEGFSRLPARDPADDTPADRQYLSELRKDIPIEVIDFFPLGDTGKDEIDVVLWRYGLGTSWTVVSLVYSEIVLPPPDPEKNVGLFDSCDQRALDWLALQDGTKRAAAFCRIDDYWYAYQGIG